MKHVVMVSALVLGLASSASAAPIQWGGNGHWYEYIGTQATWTEAHTAAQGMTHNGMPGYLATVTSADENDFISSNVAKGQLVWLGATDRANEGTWVWQGGPEHGQVLTYTNWAVGEPNDAAGEDELQMNWLANTGTWNDHGTPGAQGQRNGYVVEYSGQRVVPEPATVVLAGLGLAGLARRRRRP